MIHATKGAQVTPGDRRTALRALPVLLAMLCGGCASTQVAGGAQPQRLTAAQVARLSRPAVRPLSAAQLVELARQHPDAGFLEDRIRDHGVDFELDARQVVDLQRQGVPIEVLEHLRQAQLQAQLQARLHAQAMAQEAREDALRQQLARERAWRDPYLYDPWWPHPWLGWYPHRHGPDASFGLWWGW